VGFFKKESPATRERLPSPSIAIFLTESLRCSIQKPEAVVYRIKPALLLE
jgi:hypothetical protein